MARWKNDMFPKRDTKKMNNLFSGILASILLLPFSIKSSKTNYICLLAIVIFFATIDLISLAFGIYSFWGKLLLGIGILVLLVIILFLALYLLDKKKSPSE